MLLLLARCLYCVKPPIANGYIKYEWIEVSRIVEVVLCVRTQHLPSRVSAAVEGDWAEFFQLSQQVLKTVEVVLVQDMHQYLTPKRHQSLM